MANWNSKDGICTPAQESAVLKTKGTPANPNGQNILDEKGQVKVYNGPCREATKVLKQSGEDHIGMHYRDDPTVIERARELRKTVDEFTKTNEDTIEARKAQHEVDENRIVAHGFVERKNPIKIRSGGNKMKGGFGDGPSAQEDALAANPKYNG